MKMKFFEGFIDEMANNMRLLIVAKMTEDDEEILACGGYWKDLSFCPNEVEMLAYRNTLGLNKIALPFYLSDEDIIEAGIQRAIIEKVDELIRVIYPLKNKTVRTRVGTYIIIHHESEGFQGNTSIVFHFDDFLKEHEIEFQFELEMDRILDMKSGESIKLEHHGIQVIKM